MKIKGLRQLCGATKNLPPKGYAPRYKIQVHIDVNTGNLIWSDIVGNGCIVYDDHTFHLIDIEHPATMAEIKEMVDCRRNMLLEKYNLQW